MVGFLRGLRFKELRISGLNIILNWPLILVIIIGLGVCGYLAMVGLKGYPIYPEILQRLPAGVFKFVEKEKPKEEEFPVPEIEIPKEKKYVEKAEWGEGITHLARRALKKYLQENPQDFEVTPEHKIYIEDYLAKKKGGGWLRLGEELEFSEDLIKEGIEKSEELTPQQLENLVQYSQLVPSLNY
ncbi:MAG: hypothetical protein QME61_02940 [Patescibacteria group bacterium]|nr:hypothetical protein [Patescibacteria group bacterium]